MKIKLRKPKSFIYQYCFLCVLIGCVAASMNAHLFEPPEAEITPLRTLTIAPKAQSEPIQESDTVEGEGCPTEESVTRAVAECNAHVNNTQKLIAVIRNDGDAEQRKLEPKVAMWEAQARNWERKNTARICSCNYLYGATGYLVHPEFPMAFENLKHSGNWLELAVNAAQDGKFKDANDYILAARRATRQAGKLVAGKIRPKSKYAMVSLPRHLATRKSTSV